MVILDPGLDERTVAPSLDTFLNVIRQEGGSVDKVDVWGKRSFAYEINKQTQGIYAVIQLQSEPDAVKELDQIGRASCRERVSRLGVSVVVRGEDEVAR